MRKDFHINTLSDMLELSPDEFRRMLPDLALWYAFAKPLHGVEGVENAGFEWTDDGDNRVAAVHMTDPATGHETKVAI
jgi:hypothetical protein